MPHRRPTRHQYARLSGYLAKQAVGLCRNKQHIIHHAMSKRCESPPPSLSRHAGVALLLLLLLLDCQRSDHIEAT